MRKAYVLFTALFLFVFSTHINAQLANCGASPASAGSLATPISLDVPIGSSTPAPTLTGYSAGLPNIEYVAVNPNDLVISPDGILGPKIIGTNFTGVFDPAALGLVAGDQIAVLAFTYDLSVVQNAVDELLFGSFFGVPCCSLFQAFFDGDLCDTLMSAGVSSSADVNSLTDVLGFASAFGDNNSIEAALYIIDTVINEVIYDGTPCTGGVPICYTATPYLTFNVVSSGSLCSTAPTGLAASVSPAAVILSWNSAAADGALGYRVCGRPLGSSALGCGPIILEPNTTFALPASVLSSGVTYEWNVTAGCAIDGSVLSPTSAWSTFTALSPRLASFDVKLMPNPATNRLVISGNATGVYRIVNLSGILLAEGQLAGTVTEVDLSDFSNGLYLLELEDGSVSKFEVVQ